MPIANRPGLRATACAAVLVMGSSTGCSVSSEARSGELACDKYEHARSVEICRSIASELEWEVSGHAILSPGYKVTTRTLVDTFCKLKLTRDDVQALEPLTRGETRLRGAADSLLAMLGANPSVGANSIVNPNHPQFLLKDGCP